MNIIEAIKSGRPYRRKLWAKATCQPPTLWCVKTIDMCGQLQLVKDDMESFAPQWDDLLADDWEIQEPTVTITKAQFYSAVDDAGLCAREVRTLARSFGLEL